MRWKLATFNVNGIRSRREVVISWIQRNRPDVLCLQEIKCTEAEFPIDQVNQVGYKAAICGQKSFHGVAVLSLREPEEVRRGFEANLQDEEARFIAVRFGRVWVINTYVPQGRSPEHSAFKEKLAFFSRLRAFFDREFSPNQPIIWTGDLNVAPEEIDVFSPRRMEGKIGFHPAERKALADVVSWGLEDLFRKHHPELRQFTFWDYRLPESFRRNLGWRIDHIFATEPIANASTDCRVDTGPRAEAGPSDHTPVWAEFELDSLPQ